MDAVKMDETLVRNKSSIKYNEECNSWKMEDSKIKKILAKEWRKQQVFKKAMTVVIRERWV